MRLAKTVIAQSKYVPLLLVDPDSKSVSISNQNMTVKTASHCSPRLYFLSLSKSRLRAVPLRSVKSKLGRTGESDCSQSSLKAAMDSSIWSGRNNGNKEIS